MKAFDAEGNEIEVFSQEELDAKLKEATPAPAPAPIEKKEAESTEIPVWAKELMGKVDALSGRETQTYVGRVVSGLDTDRKKEVEAKFQQLSGYDETPDGLARRAEDAYLLATGEKFNADTVNMKNLAAAGGGKTDTAPKVTTEADKQIQSALGITQADVDKFGKK